MDVGLKEIEELSLYGVDMLIIEKVLWASFFYQDIR
jgi:hypothetical protein